MEQLILENLLVDYLLFLKEHLMNVSNVCFPSCPSFPFWSPLCRSLAQFLAALGFPASHSLLPDTAKPQGTLRFLNQDILNPERRLYQIGRPSGLNLSSSICFISHPVFAVHFSVFVFFDVLLTWWILVMFNSYDMNGDGCLDRKELFKMFQSSTKSSGKNVDEALLRKMVEETIQLCDEDKNGEISFEEFHKAVHSGKLSFSLLATNP
jgi:hypothetical protein